MKPPPAPKPSRSKITGRVLTDLLRELSAEVETMDNDGRILTRAEVLATLIWKKALGYTEVVDVKTGEEIKHSPDQRCIELLYDRLEGKAIMTVVDESSRGPSVAERVSDLGKSRINALSVAAGAVPETGGGVDMPENGPPSSQGGRGEPGVAGSVIAGGAD